MIARKVHCVVLGFPTESDVSRPQRQSEGATVSENPNAGIGLIAGRRP
jgi:hypothetical protein